MLINWSVLRQDGQHGEHFGGCQNEANIWTHFPDSMLKVAAVKFARVRKSCIRAQLLTTPAWRRPSRRRWRSALRCAAVCSGCRTMCSATSLLSGRAAGSSWMWRLRRWARCCRFAACARKLWTLRHALTTAARCASQPVRPLVQHAHLGPGALPAGMPRSRQHGQGECHSTAAESAILTAWSAGAAHQHAAMGNEGSLISA